MKRAAEQPLTRPPAPRHARGPGRLELRFLPFVCALATAWLLPQALADASAAQYLLKHPRREHCRAHYAKRVKTVKVKRDGVSVKVRETFCVRSGASAPRPVVLTPTIVAPERPRFELPRSASAPPPAVPEAETSKEANEAYMHEYTEAYRAGLQAYVYSEPLVQLQESFLSDTSVTVPNHVGDAPVNQFSHFHTIASSGPGPLAPDTETLYSQAWLELGNEGPIVVHVPTSSGNFDVVPLYSPYEENFANIGEGASGLLAPGDYVIAGPNQLSGEQQVEGMQIIHSPYDRVWVLPRTLVTSEQDLEAAIATQAEMKLVPLSRWASEGLNYQPPAPERENSTPTSYHLPGTQRNEDALLYWAAVGAALKQFPPPARDAEELASFAPLDIGPGLSPESDPDLGLGALAGLRAAVRDGHHEVSTLFREQLQAGFEEHNGWGLEATGEYGTEYDLRAIVDQYFRGALDPNVALYLFADSDHTGAALDGAGASYVVHYPASDFPVPVQGFWSLTVYTPYGALFANSLHRYSLGGGSQLHFEPDGSLNLYVQTSEPTSAIGRENWLPVPAGPFQLVQRMYGVDESAIAPILQAAPGAWTPPTILPCQENGETSAGWSCAS